MLESFLILLMGIGFNIGATILTDYASEHHKVHEKNPVTRWIMTKFGRKGTYISSVIFYVILIGWVTFLATNGFGIWSLYTSVVVAVACGYDFFHDLKVYGELRKK